MRKIEKVRMNVPPIFYVLTKLAVPRRLQLRILQIPAVTY